jgi:hypothetical protein
MALTNKTIASSYKDILQVDNNGSGRTDNGTIIKDGEGNPTALTLGGNKAHIKPATNQTDAFLVENVVGSDLLKVDTTNSEVTVGATQTYANTQIHNFLLQQHEALTGQHFALTSDVFGGNTIGAISFGTGTDPATSLTLSSSEDAASDSLACYWYVPVAITIDEVRVLATGDAGNLDFHLFSYDMATGTGSDAGDLSGGTLLAHSGSVMAVNDDRILTNTLTVDSASVAADKVVIATVERIGSSTTTTVRMLVKYHYQ